MSASNTIDYYRRREEAERALADAAGSPNIAAIHREMADSYRKLTAGDYTDEQSLAALRIVRD